MLSRRSRVSMFYGTRSLIMSAKFKHCKRYNDPRHAHELTFSCFRGKRFLLGDHARQWLANAIKLARKRYALHIWAYVIMPEHAHLLIWPTESDYSMSKTLATIKLSVTRNAIRYVERYAPQFLKRMEDRQPNGEIHHRFWQRGGGYDRNSTEPVTIWNQIEYIHANPVRRGLCKHPEDWYWSSAGVYAGLRDGPIAIDRDSLPRTEAG
jgi:putative transposase